MRLAATLFMATAVFLTHSHAAAQPAPAPRFRIAHLRADPESPVDAAAFDRFRDFAATSAPAVRDALRAEGLADDIAILSADTPQILSEWMAQEQADAVFCPATTLRAAAPGAYDVAFQTRRRRDNASPAGDRVWQRGVLMARTGSPLARAAAGFTAPAPTSSAPAPSAAFAAALAGRPVAMVAPGSAAGHVYPWLKLAELTSNTLPVPSDILFCGSPEEVVKAVTNGIADLGACPEGVMEDVMARAGAADGVDLLTTPPLRVIARTGALPTDPVAFRARFRPVGGPSGRDSPVGREMREALRRFFALDPALPQLVPSSADRFEALAADMARMDALATDRDRAAAAAPPALNSARPRP